MSADWSPGRFADTDLELSCRSTFLIQAWLATNARVWFGVSSHQVFKSPKQKREIEMLVTFKTEAYASITMFGDVAVALLKLMGHSGTVPGALMPADIPKALDRLEARVAANPNVPLEPKSGPETDEEGDKPHVSLAHRALPLIELLRAAQASNTHVMWDS